MRPQEPGITGRGPGAEARFRCADLASPPPAASPSAEDGAGGDSEELERLFDSVAIRYAGPAARAADDAAADRTAANADAERRLFTRVGQLTRELHDTLSELGYAPLIEQGARAIPDARRCVTYVSEMTEQAARRVLNAVDVARPLQERIAREHASLTQRWVQLHEGRLALDEFRALADDTRSYFASAQECTRGTQEQLTEIMMAQEFQDLTGQVIKKLVETVESLETELLGVLVEFVPSGPPPLASGPAVAAEGRTDVVSDQRQVDELLESMGF